MQEVRCSNHRATTLQARPRGLFLFSPDLTLAVTSSRGPSEPPSQLDIFLDRLMKKSFAREKSMLKVTKLSPPFII